MRVSKVMAVVAGLLQARHIPNAISVLRIGFIYPVMLALLEQRYQDALYWFIAAGVSDGVDGFIAKQCGWTSRLGSLLDPAADKLLLLTAYGMFGLYGLLPWPLVLAVFLRDIVIVGGAAAYWFLLRPFDAKPLLLSKINTVLQILLVAAVMFSHGVRPLADAVLNFLIACTFATTGLSGLLYVLLWSNNGWHEWRQQRSKSP